MPSLIEAFWRTQIDKTSFIKIWIDSTTYAAKELIKGQHAFFI